MQLDVVLQLDGPCEPDALRNSQTTATQFAEFRDPLGKSFGVQRHTVANATYLREADLIGRNLWTRDLRHLRGQVLVILRVVLCMCSEG